MVARNALGGRRAAANPGPSRNCPCDRSHRDRSCVTPHLRTLSKLTHLTRWPACRLSNAPSGDELCLITHDAAIRTGAVTGLLVASTEAADQLDVLCTCGTAPRTDRLSLSARSSGFAGRVLESGCAAGEPIDAKTNSYLATAASGARASYAAGAPIGSPGGPRGALCVGLPGRPPDPTTTLWVIESYARLASLCLHDRGALGGLLAAARLDGLTGCLNHAAIRTELEREIERCTRHQRTVSCCFVDLDRFKQINDRYGHVHGSRVLADIAAILRAGVRSGDTVGRYGGDEFILVLPDTDLDAAHALAGATARTDPRFKVDRGLRASRRVHRRRAMAGRNNRCRAARDGRRSASKGKARGRRRRCHGGRRRGQNRPRHCGGDRMTASALEPIRVARLDLDEDSWRCRRAVPCPLVDALASRWADLERSRGRRCADRQRVGDQQRAPRTTWAQARRSRSDSRRSRTGCESR